MYLYVPRALAAFSLCGMCLSCGNTESQPRFFSESAKRAPLQCMSVAQQRDAGSLADLVTVGDSLLLAVFPDERQIALLDGEFRAVTTLSFDKEGPRGVSRPISAVVFDGAVWVADDARSQIRRFTLTGAPALTGSTVQLPFIPRRLRATADQLIVTPLVAGGSPAHLAFRLIGNQTTPVIVPIARYDDIGINTLANMTSLAAFPDRIVLMHEMVVPFGYVLRPHNSRSSPQRFAVPLPREIRDRIGHLPQEPLSDKNVNDLAVVAFAATADVATGATWFVTRTGDGKRRPFQKLVVHLDSQLAVRDVFPINANPHHMAFFPPRAALIVVDSYGEWFECKLPKM